MTATNRRVFLVVVSCAMSVLLVALLIRVGKIDLRVTLEQLESVRRASFIKLLLLNLLLVAISTAKWRSIDAALRRKSDSVQSRTTSLALTSVGFVLGTVLPVQFAMATARTLGTYVHGSAIKRGAAGTLYEQSFDLLTVAFLAVASGITRASKGAAITWGISAALLLALALATVGSSARMIRWVAGRVTRMTAPETRLGALMRDFFGLLSSELLGAGLTRRLVSLSAARFAVVVLMSAQTADAVGLRIPLWHMAAATPFVVFASVIGLTPGGLGVNELTAAAALSLFGTPLAVGAQWTIANRALVTASYLVVAACAVTLLLVGRLRASNSRNPIEGH